MNKETIQALIFSEKGENDIAQELLEYFSNNPDLININYLLNRNVFHLLVIQNKAQVLKLLFEYSITEGKSWLDTAALPDRNGYTILHYAARHEEHSLETMDVLLKYFPTLINSINKYGQTPLHEAVMWFN
jgi:ankyrin repeat protein